MNSQHKRGRRLDPTVIETAKKLYMDSGKPNVSKIARDLDIDRSTLIYHINKSWEQEKRIKTSEVLGSLAASSRITVASMARNAIEAIARAIEAKNNDPQPMDMKDTKTMTEVVAKMYEITNALKKADEEDEDNTENEVVDVNDPFN